MRHHIEFLGIPGSGKTTLQRSLIQSLNKQGFPVSDGCDIALRALQHKFFVNKAPWGLLPRKVRVSLLKRLFFFSKTGTSALGRFVASNPDVSAGLFKMIDQQPCAHNHNYLFYWFADLFATYQCAKTLLSDKESLLLDEGFVNRTITLFGYSPEPVSLEKLDVYLTQIIVPDLVVWIDVPIDNALERISQRGLPARMKRLSVKERKKVLSNSNECVVQTTKRIEQMGVPVIRVLNTGPVAKGTQNITRDPWFSKKLNTS